MADTLEGRINIASSIDIIERPIDPRYIKQRDAGFGKKLDYIGGSTVIKLLNEAFRYSWSFEIINEEIVQSLPKAMYEGYGKSRKPKMVDGKQVMEDQPPYIKIKGRLTIPGVGVKEQYGTKILLGGASEQEGAAKSAATDALKKCATLVGIGLDLSGDDLEEPQASAPVVNSWEGKNSEIKRLKELKAILGISDNEKLAPFIQEFTGNKNADWTQVTPGNISSFNKFLEKKAESL